MNATRKSKVTDNKREDLFLAGESRIEGDFLDKKTNEEKVALAFESIINFATTAMHAAQKVT